MTDETVTFEYDWHSETVTTTAVVDAVATVRDRPAKTLRPLEDTIDTDALDRIFEPTTQSDRTGGMVSFVFEECNVTVTAGGTIEVRCPAE